MLNDREKAFARELQLQIQIMDDRDATGEPFRADEVMVSIPRDKYRSLCEYSLKGLRANHEH